MRISVRRTGGFAGVEEALGAISTESLHPEDADRLEHAVEALAAHPGSQEEIGADLFEYRIVVAADEGERALVVRDAGEPEGPRDPALADILRLLAAGGRDDGVGAV